MTVTWLALEPPSFRLAAGDDSQGEPERKGTPDALAAVPSHYGEVPRLGPPLPGDLGRPILEQQRSRQGYEPGGSSASEAERARSAAEAERQRLVAQRETARSSAVIVQLSGRGASADLLPGAGGAGEPEAVPAPLALPSADGGAQDRRLASFGSDAADTNDHRLRDAPSPFILTAGTIIPASLITGLNSDLPGMVLAQVTENVRDSVTGNIVLIPQGARLIGRYDSVVTYGQRRALLVWQRIVFPDGASIRLDNMPATDLAGYAGVEDEVDNHTWRLLKGVALSTLLGVGTEISHGGSESDLVRAVREATQQNSARAGDRITQRNLDVQPTLIVRPGWPLRAIVHKDLVLRPYKG